MLPVGVTTQPVEKHDSLLKTNENSFGSKSDAVSRANNAYESLFQEEDRAEGHVTAKIYRLYARLAGGRLLLFCLMAALGFSLCFRILNQYWFIWWLEYSLKLSSPLYMAGYIVLTLAQAASLGV